MTTPATDGEHNTAEPRPREKRDPEATRQALLRAGAALFSERGYDAVPIDEVAARAHVNKALISYHFGGKRGLYVAILASAFRELAGRMETAEAAAPTAPAALHELLQVFDRFRREHPEFPSLFMREVLSTGVEPQVAPHLVSIIGTVRRVAARGAREGSFRAVNPLLLHFGLVGALVFFSSTERPRQRAVAEGRVPFPMPEFSEFLRYMEELTLRGLAPDAASAAARSKSRAPRRHAPDKRKPKGARS